MVQTFEEFLAVSRAQIPVMGFVVNLLIAAMLSLILGQLYLKYGECLSNRKQFGRNFLLITMTTMLIISIVKSSLALSLGLVGALSIIRFRAAIKEPEELSYLFLAIAIGLGYGANQGVVTTIAFFIIVFVIILVKKFSSNDFDNQNLHLTINSTNSSNITISSIVDVLKRHCNNVSLKRLDESSKVIEASFLVEFTNIEKLNDTKIELQKLDSSIGFSFLDNKSVF